MSHQWWHPANRMADGEAAGACCSGLRSWNSDQCIVGNVEGEGAGIQTGVCDMEGPSSQLVQLEGGQLVVGAPSARRCVYIADGGASSLVPALRLGECDDAAVRRIKWDAAGTHEPMEFRLLDQDTRRQWESAQVHGSARVLVGAGGGGGAVDAGAGGEKVNFTGLAQALGQL